MVEPLRIEQEQALKKQTFDHTAYKDDQWREDLLKIFEEIAYSDMPKKDKRVVVEQTMQSLFYGDRTCDCLGERQSYPYKIEDQGNDSLLASYECRNCGKHYTCGFAKGYHQIMFG
jgi:hypothetical protein